VIGKEVGWFRLPGEALKWKGKAGDCSEANYLQVFHSNLITFLE
jgi:hypothetical protein